MRKCRDEFHAPPRIEREDVTGLTTFGLFDMVEILRVIHEMQLSSKPLPSKPALNVSGVTDPSRPLSGSVSRMSADGMWRPESKGQLRGICGRRVGKKKLDLDAEMARCRHLFGLLCG